MKVIEQEKFELNCDIVIFKNPNQNLIDLNDSEEYASNYNNRIRQNVMPPPAMPNSLPVGDVPKPARSSRNSPPPNYQNNARFHVRFCDKTKKKTPDFLTTIILPCN